MPSEKNKNAPAGSDPPTRVTVGRKPGNTLVLPNADVSGDHALLTLRNPLTEIWEIQDLGSRNGTFVDGQRVKRKEVTPANAVVFGSTPLDWQKLSVNVKKSRPKPAAQVGKTKPTVAIAELTDEQRLRGVYEDYIAKRSQLEEIQRNEALNARFQSLGIPIAALFGCSAPFLPPEYRYISIVGAVISIAVAAWSFQMSKRYAAQKRELNMTRLTEQYDINYRCPHCRVKLTDPFPVLLLIKNCRSCKKPLITNI